MSQPAIFLDKDGTLIKDVPYNVDPARIELEAGVVTGLRRLAQTGLPLVIVTNQSGVARGYFDESALTGLSACLSEILQREAGANLAGFYYCPHHPDGTVAPYAVECNCRKPHPGLLLRAANEMALSLPDSWMVGDILNDIEAGKRAGCRTILIDNGNESEWQAGPYRQPDFIAAHFDEAAEIIITKLNG